MQPFGQAYAENAASASLRWHITKRFISQFREIIKLIPQLINY
jgi:hypothetical protein